MKRSAQTGWVWAGGGIFLFLLAPFSAAAQLQSVNGTFAAGLYSVNSSSLGTVKPAGFEFDTLGYLGHPDFLSYSVRPWFNFGDPFGGLDIRPGKGLAVTSSFFRRRAFPFSLTYSRLKSSAVGLDPQSINFGFSRLGNTNQANNFALSGQLLHESLPSLSYAYGTDKNTTQADGLGGLIGSASTGKNYRFGISDDLLNWRWRLGYNKRDISSGLESAPTNLLLNYSSDSSTLDFGGRGPVGSLGDAVLRVERTTRDATLGTNQQENTALRARLSFESQPIEPLSLRASFLLQSGRLATNILQASSSSESEFDSYSAQFLASYKIHSDWTVGGSVGRSGTKTGVSNVTSSRRTSLVSSVGLAYSHAYDWATVTASYHRAFSGAGSSSDESIGNQDSAQLTFRGGRLDSLAWDAGVSYFQQALDGLSSSVGTFFSNRSKNLSLNFSLQRRVAGVLLRGNFAVQESSASLRDVSNTEINTSNLAFNLGASHKRFEIEYNENMQEQESFLPLLPGLSPFVTSLEGKTVRGRIRLLPGLETHALYRSSGTTIFLGLRSELKNLIVAVRYRFRQLELEGGYNRVEDGILLAGPGKRAGYYFRVIRRFRIL